MNRWEITEYEQTEISGYDRQKSTSKKIKFELYRTTYFSLKNYLISLSVFVAQLAGVAEYTDCISAEE